MAVTAALEAALDAIADRLTAQLSGVAVQRGRRSMINTGEPLPRVVLRMGPIEEAPDDSFGLTLLRCAADVEGYAAAPADATDADAALEAALNDLHARCHAALAGVEIGYGAAGATLVVEGREMTPEVPLLVEASEAVGGFNWTIGFEIRAAIGTGPFTTT